MPLPCSVVKISVLVKYIAFSISNFQGKKEKQLEMSVSHLILPHVSWACVNWSFITKLVIMLKEKKNSEAIWNY